jgi:5-methylcytosine-specific restriction endonuclease McrA
MALTMRYGDNTYSAKAIKRAKANRRKLGVLEQAKPSNPANVAGTPYRYQKKSKTYYAKYSVDPFYESREWLAVRYQALMRYGARCMCCGATRRDNAIIQVDHIKPRSRYPALALDIDNLQILCRDCNMGKSNTDATDWRSR